MPIEISPESGQITVHFKGGDIVAGLCGDEGGEIDSVGLADASTLGASGEIAEDESSGDPVVLLRFDTREALESFIGVLIDYREEKFGSEK